MHINHKYTVYRRYSVHEFQIRNIDNCALSIVKYMNLYLNGDFL